MKEPKLKTVFSEKNHPIPIEMRPIWRMSLIVIAILKVSGSKKYLDMTKLNILVWMLIRKAHWDEYSDYLSDRTLDLPFISVDTSTYKAVEYSVAKDFVSLKNGRLYVNVLGEELCSLIDVNELFREEVEFLSKYGKKLTDGKVKGLMGRLL